MTAQAQRAMEDFMARARGGAAIEVATVKSVDEASNTCVVTLMNDTEIPDVRLKAAIDEVTDGIVQMPAVNSSVLVATIGGNNAMRFVIAFSQVTKIVMFGGEKGPIVIWDGKLKPQLDKVKQVLTAFLNVATGAPITEPGNGAPSAFQQALASAFAGMDAPDFDDLTDTKITH
jgi:hypothetical protein